jgi:hypothetical protein
METANFILQLIMAASAVFATIGVWYGLHSWKTQAHGQYNIKLARKMRRAIGRFRQSLMTGIPGSEDEVKKQYREQHDKVLDCIIDAQAAGWPNVKLIADRLNDVWFGVHRAWEMNKVPANQADVKAIGIDPDAEYTTCNGLITDPYAKKLTDLLLVSDSILRPYARQQMQK